MWGGVKTGIVRTRRRQGMRGMWGPMGRRQPRREGAGCGPWWPTRVGQHSQCSRCAALWKRHLGCAASSSGGRRAAVLKDERSWCARSGREEVLAPAGGSWKGQGGKHPSNRGDHGNGCETGKRAGGAGPCRAVGEAVDEVVKDVTDEVRVRRSWGAGCHSGGVGKEGASDHAATG